ncbi:flagellar hook-associated protein FlgL [Balneolales bacterium ANBcel1]|nr:flagellar hook-associated protein FlgL [Balneolales bacterium ANBcel1]
MRITQKIIFDDFIRDINKNRSQMAGIQSDLSSGKRVRLPSQDPTSFQRSRIIEEDIRKQEQYQKNISSGLRQGRLAQEALDETIDNMIDIKRILTQAATDTSSATVRESMAQEIAGIRDSMVATLNTSYGDRYLFAGTNSGVRPFQFDELEPGGVADHSNSSPLKVQAGDELFIEFSVTGTDLRESGAGDMFEIIDNIHQALLDNDTAALNGMMSDVDQMIDHSSIVTSRLGNNINRLEFMFEQYESTNIVMKSDVSNLVDTDFAKAFSDMQRTQISFEAAMAVHTQMIHNTLLDYL